MQYRYARLSGAAFGVLVTGAIGLTAQAAPRHNHPAAGATADTVTQEKIESLTAAVSALESRLNDETAARQADEARAQAWCDKQVSFDPDLWILEIEDRQGRAFVDEEIV